MDDLPKAHPTHHRNTMIGAAVLAAMLLPVGLLEEQAGAKAAWCAPVLAGLWLASFAGWMLWRVNRIKCPQCGRQMTHVLSHNNAGNQTEIFRCEAGHGQWSVPGVSAD